MQSVSVGLQLGKNDDNDSSATTTETETASVECLDMFSNRLVAAGDTTGRLRLWDVRSSCTSTQSLRPSVDPLSALASHGHDWFVAAGKKVYYTDERYVADEWTVIQTCRDEINSLALVTPTSITTANTDNTATTTDDDDNDNSSTCFLCTADDAGIVTTPVVEYGHDENALCLSLLYDGKYLWSGASTATLHRYNSLDDDDDDDDDTTILSHTFTATTQFANPPMVNHLLSYTNNTIVASLGDGSLALLDKEDCQVIHRIWNAHAQAVVACTRIQQQQQQHQYTTNDKLILASIGNDSRVALWKKNVCIGSWTVPAMPNACMGNNNNNDLFVADTTTIVRQYIIR